MQTAKRKMFIIAYKCRRYLSERADFQYRELNEISGSIQQWLQANILSKYISLSNIL